MRHFSSWFQRTLIPIVLLALTACPGTAVPKPASIEGFTATPNTLPAGGGTIKLEWNVTNAQNILIGPNIGSVSGNSRDVQVSQTTTFTLTVVGSGAPVTKEVQVTVEATASPPGSPVISSFTATPGSLPTGGGTVKLEWNVANATAVSIDQGVGTVTGSSLDVSVSASRTFTLTASNAAGNSQAQTVVTVAQGAVQPYSLTGKIGGWNRGNRTVRAITQTVPSSLVGQGAITTEGNFSLVLGDPRDSGFKLGPAFPSSCNNLQSTVPVKDVLGIAIEFRVLNGGVETGALHYSSLDFFPNPLPVGETIGVYFFVDRDVRMSGPCTAGSTFTYDLDLKRGWNLMVIEHKPSGVFDVKSGSAPNTVKWLYRVKPTRIALNTPKTNLQIGESATFSATAYDDQDQVMPNASFNWTTSNSDVASINQAGTVTAKRNGGFIVNVSSDGVFASSPNIGVSGLDILGGTFNTGQPTLGTAFSMRYTTTFSSPPNTDQTITITGPNGWNGGKAYTITYPKDKYAHRVYLENIPAVTGTYTTSVGSGSVTFNVNATQKLDQVKDLKINSYTSSSVNATWTNPSGSNLTNEMRVVDKTNGQTVGESQVYYYSNVTWNGPSVDLTHQNELHVLVASADFNSYSGASFPTQFNASRVTQALDYSPTITGLGVGGAPSTGGMLLTISGAFFSNGATVKFGNTNSSSVAVDSQYQISAVIPAGVAGTVDVTVTTAAGTSSPIKFTYFAVSEYTVNANARLALGPDGNIWFVEGNQTTLGKITATGTITRYNLPANWNYVNVFDIATGPDNRLWLSSSDYYNNGQSTAKLAAFNTSSSTFTEYDAPVGSGGLTMLVAGPDNNLWGTYRNGPTIAKLAPANASVINTYTLPVNNAVQGGEMIVGPDQNIWMADSNNGKVGRVTTGGTVTMFTLPGPTGMVNGPDGNLWVTTGSHLNQVTTSGTIMPVESGGSTDLALGSDNRFWYRASDYYWSNAFRVGRMGTDGKRILIALPNSVNEGIFDLVADKTGKIWYSRGTRIGVITP